MHVKNSLHASSSVHKWLQVHTRYTPCRANAAFGLGKFIHLSLHMSHLSAQGGE